jgi:ATP-dependent helicase Lhr and Lhr-like helicase
VQSAGLGDGFDPTRWRLEGARLVTWGGETFNTLLAALFARQFSGRRFAASPEEVSGPIFAVDVSVHTVRELALRTERDGDLPLSVAAKFTSPSRFFGELSNDLAADEKRRSPPWAPFHRWLDRVTGIDVVGSMPA